MRELVWANPNGVVRSIAVPYSAPTGDVIYSQQVFQSRPDKQAAAVRQLDSSGEIAVYVHWTHGEAWRVASGPVIDMRFSPSGRYLAVLQPGRALFADLTLRTVDEAEAPRAGRWIEWLSRSAVVLAHTNDGGAAVVEVRPGSVPVALARLQQRPTRLAASGHTVVWFMPPGAGGNMQIWGVDLSSGAGVPTRWGTGAGGEVLNAEVRPDGAEVAFATGWGLFRLSPGGLPEPVGRATAVHSLWYDTQGTLAWAGPHAVGHFSQVAPVEMDSDSRITTLRLGAKPGTSVVVSNDAAWLWRGGTSLAPLAEAPRGARVLSADAFGDGALLWIERAALAHHQRRKAH